MKFKNSQDSWEINLSKDVTDIGIKISGGADSAIVTYMLAKYVTEERPDITIHPVTGIADIKPYQLIFADQVLRKVEDLTGVVFAQHQFGSVRATHYTEDQLTLTRSLKYGKNLFTMHFNGITANPTQADAPHLYNNEAVPERIKQATKKNNHRRPLINIDKRGVAEHYTRLGVLEELFPVTRSCEEITTDFSKHCQVCWFCAERHWGFGRYV
mgnify:FL=1|jgi:hypothetical protein|tara:strand:- start:315 stop:953 length:639 start_codon:yes stop_codon:yes gene_type:complete